MTVEVETTNAGCHVGVTPAILERLVQQVSDDNPYLNVGRDDREGFAYARLVPPKKDGRRRFQVGYRESPDHPMYTAELVLDRAVDVLLGWAYDRAGWTAGIRWHTEELESMIDLRGQTEVVDGPAGQRQCRLRGTAAERAPDVPEIAPFWDIVGAGATDDLAYNEFFTGMAVSTNSGEEAARVAWSRWLGRWEVKLPREDVRRRRTSLDEDQQRRISESSGLEWPDSDHADDASHMEREHR